MNGNIKREVFDTVKDTLRLQCITIIVEAYKISISQLTKEYDRDWEEDQFTAYLLPYMKNLPFTLDERWTIDPQTPIYTEEISSGKVHPNKAKRPDIKFSKYHFSNPKPIEFYIEAKNISENNWQKKCGSDVNASNQRARYIDTGIQNFKEGLYPDGCLAGYVVQSNNHNAVKRLNEFLKKRGREGEILIKKQLINAYDYCYESRHLTINTSSIQIHHIFLEFSDDSVPGK